MSSENKESMDQQKITCLKILATMAELEDDKAPVASGHQIQSAEEGNQNKSKVLKVLSKLEIIERAMQLIVSDSDETVIFYAIHLCCVLLTDNIDLQVHIMIMIWWMANIWVTEKSIEPLYYLKEPSLFQQFVSKVDMGWCQVPNSNTEFE